MPTAPTRAVLVDANMMTHRLPILEREESTEHFFLGLFLLSLYYWLQTADLRLELSIVGL